MQTFIHDFQNAPLVGGVSLAPGSQQVGDGTKTGSAVDLANGAGQTHALLLVGNIDAYDDVAITLSLTESDTSGGDYTDIDGSAVKAVATGVLATASQENRAIRLSAKNRSKRYVKAKVVVAGTEGSTGTELVELACWIFEQQRHHT